MDALQQRVAEWAHRELPPETAEQRALVIAEEAGEVCRAVLKRAQGIRGTQAEWSEQLRLEVGDVMIGLLALASTEGWSLQEAATERFAQIEARSIHSQGIPG